jgi:hypothetical protein
MRSRRHRRHSARKRRRHPGPPRTTFEIGLAISR